MVNADCKHRSVTCLNHFDWIRKYRCDDCGAVMICACDRQLGTQCLPHQLDQAQLYSSQRFVSVTLGFVAGICNTCRGLREEPHPTSQRRGRSGKIARYYWREIATMTLQRFDDWSRAQGFENWIAASGAHADVRERIEREVIEEIKELHKRAPKYDLKEDSQDDIVRRFNVEVIPLRGSHVHTDDGLRIVEGDKKLSPEAFAARYFEQRGYRALFLESRPFHVLFAVFTWMLIQDPDDPLGRPAGFGARDAFKQGQRGQMIWVTLPQDFASPDYCSRRREAVEEHFRLLAEWRQNLVSLFDHWLEPSESLRQYLWAHEAGDIARARELVGVLPPGTTLAILRFLLEHYWGRYVGWPDLLCYRDSEFLLVEVKSSTDKLSNDQKNWIALNDAHLRLPFKVVKIHRA